MINLFKINGFEFTADPRAYAKITGLTPCDLAVNTATVGKYKRLKGSVMDNREIQITGAVSDTSFIKDIYKYLKIGNTYNIEIGTEDTEKKLYCDGLVYEITIDRYKVPVTYTIKLTCDSSFLYGVSQSFENTGTDEMIVKFDDDYETEQNDIKIYHTIQSGEKSLTVDFFGKTTIEYDADYEGKKLVIDLLNQTCKIGKLNRFYLVTEWANGLWSEKFSIPANTKIEYKEKFMGVW